MGDLPYVIVLKEPTPEILAALGQITGSEAGETE